jgi:hypothetical protein
MRRATRIDIAMFFTIIQITISTVVEIGGDIRRPDPPHRLVTTH